MSQQQEQEQEQPTQKQTIFKTLWGVEVGPPTAWPALFARIAAEGFQGVEVCVGPFFPFGADESLFAKLLQEHKLRLICQIHTCGYPISSYRVEDHISSFKELVLLAAKYAPVLINSHSGKDSFSQQDALRFFHEAEAFVAAQGPGFPPVVHETHRSRILYSALKYRDLMAAGLPQKLLLTADISHWVVVSERVFDALDEDFWPGVLSDVAKRCALIHARVGGAQTPQVMDPFDTACPVTQHAVQSHLQWWRTIVASMRARGVEVLLEPEFGGDPYLARLPFTHQPIVDIWAINTKMAQLLRTALKE